MTDATLPPARASVPAVPMRERGPIGRFLRDYPPLVLLALAWIGAMIVVALFADLIMPYDFKALDLRDRLAAPVFMGGTERHLLGSDELGRDVLSRLIESVRMSLTIAFASTAITATIGVTLGFLAAHFRGIVDHLVLGAIDFMAAIPFLIVALAVLAFFGNSLTLFILLMGMHGWERIARITRALALSAHEQGYASAAREIGASPWRVYGLHVLPNIASTLIVAVTLNVPEVILLESGLSFLGLGVQPPLTSLGNMVGYGREYIQTAPWIMLAPAVVITATTLAISIVGDWLRDRLDPTLR
jgi:peptide/nickel transport system permease protein